MYLINFIPIAIFIATICALLYLRRRDYAALTQNEKKELLVQQGDTTSGKAGGKLLSFSERVDESMPAFVSLIVLAASIYVILSGRYGEGQNKWAFGSVGMILGYWLRSTVKGWAHGFAQGRRGTHS
jgi:hypothetical protein